MVASNENEIAYIPTDRKREDEARRPEPRKDSKPTKSSKYGQDCNRNEVDRQQQI